MSLAAFVPRRFQTRAGSFEPRSFSLANSCYSRSASPVGKKSSVSVRSPVSMDMQTPSHLQLFSTGHARLVTTRTVLFGLSIAGIDLMVVFLVTWHMNGEHLFRVARSIFD